jgi:sec-independent protein translocase protein TatA
MPNIGPGELILILVIVLVIFGPGKLPDIGNAIGRGVREFRKASTDLEDTIRGESKPAPPSSDATPGEGSAAGTSTPGSSPPESK